MKTTHTIIRFIALAVLLTAGYTMAQATVSNPVIFDGFSVINGNQSSHYWRIRGFGGTAAGPTSGSTGTSQTFNNTFSFNKSNRMTVNGTLNYAVANNFTDVTTGSQVTLIIESPNYWFYGANVKTLSDANVTGCSYSISSDRHTITVTIPSGKTFGNVYLECVNHAPMTNENTNVTVPSGDYWVSDNNHKPEPEPTVVYGNTTLVKDTDYTLSWSNNSSAGTGTVTVTGIGNYAGTATGTFPIRWAKYYVHFDKNHDAATGTMNNQPFTYHTAQTLTANAFSRFGYDFAGWSTTPNGAVAYPDQQSVNNLSVNDGETINLYVKWMPSWTGEGSQNSPYMITNPSQLVKLATDVNGGNDYSGAYFKLGHDIDLSGIPFDGIGNSSTAFAGTFDGDLKMISNLTINSSDSYKGLFGVVTGTVRNVFLDGASITCAGDYGGVLAGKSDNGSFSNNYYHNCTLTKDGSTATTNIGFGGGIGDGNNCQIVYKLIIGDNVTIYNAHNVSVVIGTDTYGVADWSAYFRLSDGVDPGYSASFHYNDGTVHDLPYNSAQNYYYLNSTAQDVEVSVTLTDVWGIDSGADGTQDHPYMITTTDGLDLLANMVNGTHGYAFEVFTNKFFKLGADITYNTEGLGTNESNYTAIGGIIQIEGYTKERFFRGIFDGDNKTISGIRINNSSDYQGLFGWVDGSSVKNVVLANSVIKGKLYIGGIVGEAIRSTVSNCRVVSGDIIGHSRTGGITGDNSSFSIVSNCRVENGVKINTTEIRGGIVGYNSGVVSGCISSATFVGTSSYSGGITGSGDGGIKDCLFTGTINGSSSGSIYGGYIDYILTNNYYNYTTDGAYGIPYNDVDGARRAYTITLGENIALVGDRTAYNTSGLTAIGTTALSYNDGTTTTIYSGEGQTVTLASKQQGLILSDVTVNGNPATDNGDGTWSFTMPAANVTVSATATIPTGTFSYIDADGIEQQADALLLTGSETVLGTNGQATWYVAGSDISYDHQVTLNGNVHLILADGKTMNMTQTGGSQYCMYGNGKVLSIYGQSGGTGALTINSAGFGISAETLVINGGHITATTSKDALIAENDLTINNGVVKATSSGTDYSGILSQSSGTERSDLITINGGQVESNRITIKNGDESKNLITLGYRNADDYILVNKYDAAIVQFAYGKIMTDGTNYRYGSYCVDFVRELDNKKLQPVLAVTVDYVDANGDVQTASAIPLPDEKIDLNFNIISEKQDIWYIVGSNINYDSQLNLKGDVHLILADGKTMTITEKTRGNVCIQASSLTIYGQSGGTGTLELEDGIFSAGIGVASLVINGGCIRTSLQGLGLINEGDGFIINGGQVETSRFVCHNTTILLGYRNSSDFVKCNEYICGQVEIASGQIMVDENGNTYSGTLTSEQITAISGKTLRPYIAPGGTLTLVQGTRDGVTAWWGTFFDSANNYTLPEGAAAYTMDGNHNLYRLGDNGRTIPKGKAVVVIATEAAPVTPATSPATATIALTSAGTEELSIADHTPGNDGNILQGSNVSVTVTDGKITIGSEQKSVRVLGVVGGVVGFYPFATTFTGTIPAHKAYY